MFVLFLFVAFAQSQQVKSTVLVNTTHGPVMGLLLENSSNHTYRRFQGVPFATPPIPPRRFMKAIPPSPWGPSPLNCTYFDIGCAQSAHSLDVPKNKSEDCLYLEIFAPPVGKFQEPAALAIWFYGN